jgi:limonene-1,2-epoxide hydrolase
MVDSGNPDAGDLRAFLAGDIAYQYEDLRIEGLDASIARAAPKLSAVSGYDVDLGRLAVIENTVLNERVDIATLPDGQQIRLSVASVLRIADGKIAEWREHSLPAIDLEP